MQEGVRSAVSRTVTRKKTSSVSDHQEEDIGRAVAESLSKNLIAAHPVQDSQADEGSGGTCSPATPCAQRYGTGKAKGRLRCGLSETKEGGRRLTEDFLFYACAREGESQRRNSEVEETVTGAINSPPPSRRETPIIMWIK